MYNLLYHFSKISDLKTERNFLVGLLTLRDVHVLEALGCKVVIVALNKRNYFVASRICKLFTPVLHVLVKVFSIVKHNLSPPVFKRQLPPVNALRTRNIVRPVPMCSVLENVHSEP